MWFLPLCISEQFSSFIPAMGLYFLPEEQIERGEFVGDKMIYLV